MEVQFSSVMKLSPFVDGVMKRRGVPTRWQHRTQVPTRKCVVVDVTSIGDEKRNKNNGNVSQNMFFANDHLRDVVFDGWGLYNDGLFDRVKFNRI